MKAIGWGRVLIGGLAAGVVILVGEVLLSQVVFGEVFRDLLGRFGIGTVSAFGIVVAALALLVLGVAAVWLYAAIRPRFGPGPGTAVIAAIYIWILIWGGFAVISALVPLFSGSVVTVTLLWGLVEIVLATLVGARLYREPA